MKPTTLMLNRTRNNSYLYFVRLWSALLFSGAVLPLCGYSGAASAAADEQTDTSAEFDQAVRTTTQDIKEARRDYEETAQRVNNKRTKLLQNISSLRETTRTLDKEVNEKSSKKAQLTDRVEALENDIETKQQVLHNTKGILTEMKRDLPQYLHPARAQKLSDTLEPVSIKPEQGRNEGVSDAWDTIGASSVSLLEQSLGGDQVSGQAIAPSGERKNGTYVVFGPVAYFDASADNNIVAGPAFLREKKQTLLPSVSPHIRKPQQAAVHDFFQNQRGELPFDPTLGKALRLAEAEESVVDQLKQGRITMIPLLMLGAACVFFTVYKLLTLRGVLSRRVDEQIGSILNALNSGEFDRAQKQTDRLPTPLASVIREGLKHRDAPKDQLEEVMREQMLAQKPWLERFLSPLAVSASAAPLLGLLGTVTGMIHTFRLITVFGSGEAEVLSTGISEALITTQVGLIIAVPALLLHAYFSRRVGHALALTRQSAVMFVNGLIQQSEYERIPSQTDEKG